MSNPGALFNLQLGKGLPPEFIREARELDGRIEARILKIKEEWTQIGVDCCEFAKKGYYRALVNPATGVPYRNLNEWAEYRFEIGRAQMFRIMNIVRELHQDVGLENVQDMSQSNAELLTKVPKKMRTTEVIEAAKKLPSKGFQSVIADILPGEQKESMTCRIGPYSVHKDVFGQFALALQIAEALVRDGDRSRSLTEKALEALATEFIITHRDAYDAIGGHSAGIDESDVVVPFR